MSYLGWGLIFQPRNNNWADPREWEHLPYMGLLLFFTPQGTEENHQVIILTYTSVTKSFPHSTPSSPTSGAATHTMKTWRCIVLTSLQGLFPYLLEVLPVGNLQPPDPLGGSLCAMTHPGGGIKAWPVDMSGQPWKAIFTPEPSLGQLRSSDPWSSLFFFSLCSIQLLHS